MRFVQPLIVIAITGAIAACGSGSSGSVAKARATVANGNASAMQVATAARNGTDCPAGIKTPARATGAPVDDIRGVRPGLTYAEAANVVMCSNPLLVVTAADDRGFQINTFGQKVRQGFTARTAEPHVAKTGRQIMQEMEREQQARMSNAVQHDLKPGEEKWFVSTMGVPGQERVIGVARENWFAEGKNPTVDSVAQALIKKYGQPTHKQNYNSSSTRGKYYYMRWAYDPQGQRITQASPLHGCDGVANPDDGFNLSANCGVVVKAIIISEDDNAALARTLQVGVVDQAMGYALLTATESGLKSMDAARRAQEVKKAAKNAKALQF